MLPELFVEVVRMCASLGMGGLGHIASDGTKLKANASVRQTRDKEGLEKEIERIKEQMKEMVQASSNLDKLEDQIYPDGDGSEMAEELRRKGYRLEKLQEAREVLEKEKLEKVNVTDTSSRLMKDSREVVQPSYNGQIVVDDKEQVIVAADISQNTTDHAEFEPMVEQVERNLGGLPEQGSADAGYSSYDNLELADKKKLDMYMPDNFLEALDGKEESEKRYNKGNFRYDEERDVYICPEGHELKRWQEQKREGKTPLILHRGEACKECAVRGSYTAGEARIISRDGREPLLEVMREKLRSDEGKRIYGKRAYTVEPVFGEIKSDGKKPSMELRGPVKVRGGFLLMCVGDNVKKIVKRVTDGRSLYPGCLLSQ